MYKYSLKSDKYSEQESTNEQLICLCSIVEVVSFARLRSCVLSIKSPWERKRGMDVPFAGRYLI